MNSPPHRHVHRPAGPRFARPSSVGPFPWPVPRPIPLSRMRMTWVVVDSNAGQRCPESCPISRSERRNRVADVPVGDARDREQRAVHRASSRAPICRSALATTTAIGQYVRLRIRLLVVVLALAATACSSSHKSVPSDPISVLKSAASTSLMTSSVTLHGVMIAQDQVQVDL